MKRDRVFENDGSPVEPFCFNEEVAAAFDDMAVRSIPLYREAQSLAASLVAAQIPGGGRVLDLGCSTGTTIALIHQRMQNMPVQYVGVDASAPMLTQCRRKLDAVGLSGNAELIEGDVRELPEGEFDVILCLYTLQFVDKTDRPDFLRHVFHKLKPGGAFFLAEKVEHACEEVEAPLTGLYYEMKRANGYSALEIARKREALENVLVPQTVNEHEENLRSAGFERVELVMKWFAFTSWMAFRS